MNRIRIHRERRVWMPPDHPLYYGVWQVLLDGNEWGRKITWVGAMKSADYLRHLMHSPHPQDEVESQP